MTWPAAGAPPAPDIPPAPGDMEPSALAARVLALARPLLVGLDVDGTLAPIVSMPDRARLLPGVAEALAVLVGVPLVHVAVVSGRSRRELHDRFPFPAGVHLIGSHGLEVEGGVELSSAERRRLAGVARLAGQAATRAPGAWVEPKPAGVALHVRNAEPEAGDRAASWFAGRLGAEAGTWVLPGHLVVDVAVRPFDKGAAVSGLQRRLDVASVCFIGDDVTDERVFSVLGPGDLGVKVGPGPTIASTRVGDPLDVADVLGILAGELAPARAARRGAGAGGGTRTPTGLPTGT